MKKSPKPRSGGAEKPSKSSKPAKKLPAKAVAKKTPVKAAAKLQITAKFPIAAKLPKKEAVKPKKVAVSAPSPKQKPVTPVEMEQKGTLVTPKKYFSGVGRRKTSVAQVRLYEDDKKSFTINQKPLDQYVPVSFLRDTILAPLRITDLLSKFSVSVRTLGGGFTGQAEAIRHGISRALVSMNPELRLTLKKAGFLTRDPREKERKKYGLKRARRAPQWSKR